MDLSDYLTLLRKRWLVIALFGAVGFGLGALQGYLATPEYRSTAKVWVSLGQGETVSELAQGSTFVQNTVQSFAAVATEQYVLEPVIEQLGLDATPRALAKTITADVPINLMVIEISVVSVDPQEAADIANAVASQLAVAAPRLSPQNTEGEASIRVETIADAPVPGVPFAPNTKLLAATGLAVGLLLGVVVAVLRELMDTKVRTSKDINRITSAAVLGVIGFERRPRADQLVMRSDARSPRAESYRRLKTNLQFLDVGRKVQCFVVTSALAGEGKSTTSINLALAVAESSRRALLIDADLRRPSIAEYTGLEGAVGLTSVLIGQASIEDVVQPWGHANLHVMTAGALPPNPTQLLGSPRMAELLAELVAHYDTVIIDCAPLLPVADAAILGRATDGALVVAGARTVHRAQLAEALASLESVGAPCLGIVLNRAAHQTGDGYYSYEPRVTRTRFRRRPRRPAAISNDLLQPMVTPLPAPLTPSWSERNPEPATPAGGADAAEATPSTASGAAAESAPPTVNLGDGPTAEGTAHDARPELHDAAPVAAEAGRG